jgi:hypothetical protein
VRRGSRWNILVVVEEEASGEVDVVPWKGGIGEDMVRGHERW